MADNTVNSPAPGRWLERRFALRARGSTVRTECLAGITGFLAAATLRYYLKQMQNDLFLGLLAYNIGPKNGGLRFIMQQYGAIDFVTIQPYLQQLPRDYPIRVLSHALAFRLYRSEGKLLAYEEGLNAVRIQQLGVPGL